MKLFEAAPQYIRMLVRDTIETYPGQWRIVHEAVQNSHDHIQLNNKIEKGAINIDLKVGSNSVSVKDNGTGIPSEKFEMIFSLGGTDKKDLTPELKALLKGSQGVGLKATVFTSDIFEVITHNDKNTWIKKVTNCWDFENPTFIDDIGEPEVKPNKTGDTGTTINYSLHDYSVRMFLNDLVNEYCQNFGLEKIENEKQLLHILETYLRTESYLGCVKMLLGYAHNHKPIDVKVNIIFDYPSLEDYKANLLEMCPFLVDDKFFSSTLSVEFPATYLDFKTIYDDLPKSDKADKLFTTVSSALESPLDPNSKRLFIQKFVKEEAKILLSRVINGELKQNTELITKHKNILERLNGIYLVIGSRTYLSKYLGLYPVQFISVNGLPTNISLTTPRKGGELGYIPNIHFVMDINTTLGFGKRNIPGVIKGQADSFFKDVFPILRRIAKAIVGERDAEVVFTGNWVKEDVYQAYNAGLNKFKETELPQQVMPQEEQDVIYIFNQLIARGKLEGYYTFGASTYKPYDALMYISKEKDHKLPTKINWKDLKTVEFKLKLSELINEFLTEKKYIQDIDLAIVWEEDYESEEICISSLERDGIEPFPGAQKRIRSGNKWCQLLVLKEFLKM